MLWYLVFLNTNIIVIKASSKNKFYHLSKLIKFN